jgi:hypothetical protein
LVELLAILTAILRGLPQSSSECDDNVLMQTIVAFFHFLARLLFMIIYQFRSTVAYMYKVTQQLNDK